MNDLLNVMNHQIINNEHDKLKSEMSNTQTYMICDMYDMIRSDMIDMIF